MTTKPVILASRPVTVVLLEPYTSGDGKTHIPADHPVRLRYGQYDMLRQLLGPKVVFNVSVSMVALSLAKEDLCSQPPNPIYGGLLFGSYHIKWCTPLTIEAAEAGRPAEGMSVTPPSWPNTTVPGPDGIWAPIVRNQNERKDLVDFKVRRR